MISACGGTTNSNNTASSTPEKTPVVETVKNNGPTLTPVLKAYCEAWKKNDEAALRKVYSADTIADFEKTMKLDNFKSKKLTEFLRDDWVPGDLCEVINEEITGDRALGKIKTPAMPGGATIEFVKESGEWKMTNKIPGSVTQSTPSVPTANGAPANAPSNVKK